VPTLPPDEVARIKEMVPTVAELRIIDLMRDYTAVRKCYFGNSIPPIEMVLIGFMPATEMRRIGAGMEADGACLAGKVAGLITCYAITLSDDLRVSETRITLLHEMAHLKVNIKFGRQMKHGEHWKKEMRRLAAAGAFDDWW
jgi:hypothetical protein